MKEKSQIEFKENMDKAERVGFDPYLYTQLARLLGQRSVLARMLRSKPDSQEMIDYYNYINEDIKKLLGL